MGVEIEFPPPRASPAAPFVHIKFLLQDRGRSLDHIAFRRLQQGLGGDGVAFRVTATGKQLGEGVAHPDQARVGGGAVEDDVEPVAVAEVTGLFPLVGLHLDRPPIRPALDFDIADFAAGALAEQIEARCY